MASAITLSASVTGIPQSVQRQVRQAQQALNRRPLTLKLDPKGFKQPLGRITGDLNEFQKSLDASVARTFAFGAAVGVVSKVSDAFKALVDSTIEVQRELKNINILLGLSTSQLAGFSKELFGVAQNTSQAFQTVATAATEFSRQGLSAEQTLKRVNDAMILTRLSGLSAEQAVSSLTAAVNGFRKEAVTSTEVVNRLANVDANFAVSSKDLADALSRAGSTAQGAKVQFNELLAAVTAVQQNTARGGSVIGNAFKSIFTRIQRSGVQDALNAIGVETRNVDGSFRSGIAIIKDYAKAYDGLTDAQRAYTAEQIAGVFQINNLRALVADLNSGFSVYERALRVASNTTNEATTRNAELNTTLAALAQQASTSFKALGAALGNVGAVEGIEKILKAVRGVADFFSNVLDPKEGNALARGFFKGIGDFITGPGLVIIGGAFLKLFTFISKQAASAVKQIFTINTETQRRAQLEQAILATVTSEESIMRKITANAGNQAAQEKIILDTLKAQNAQRAQQARFLAQLAASPAFKNLSVQGGVIAPIPGRRGARARRQGLAGGFIPNFAGTQQVIANTDEFLVRNFAATQEAKAIKKGVGGASPGARVASVMMNPARDAILNPNMVASMGLPSNAQRIGLAGGFIPNFSAPKTRVGKKATTVTLVADKNDLAVITPNVEDATSLPFKGSFEKTINGAPIKVSARGSTARLGVGGQDLGDEKNAFFRALSEQKSNLDVLGKALTLSFFKFTGLDNISWIRDAIPNSERSLTEQIRKTLGGVRGSLFENIILDLQDEIKKEAGTTGKDPIDINPRAKAGSNVRRHFGQYGKFEVKAGDFRGSGIALKYIKDLLGNLDNASGSVSAPGVRAINAAVKARREAAGMGQVGSQKNLSQKELGRQLGEAQKGIEKGAQIKLGGDLIALRTGRGWAKLGAGGKGGGPLNDTQKNELLRKIRSNAQGHIPNFANPLAKAFRTERKMGGDPVLDFDPKIGPYVRDGKTQPNFAAVKRDHPEGMPAAIQNSRMMQLAASGVIPNFAQLSFGGSPYYSPPPGYTYQSPRTQINVSPTSNPTPPRPRQRRRRVAPPPPPPAGPQNVVIQQTDDQAKADKQQKREARRQAITSGLLFAPLIAGPIAEAVGGEVGQNVSRIAGGVAMGSLFGPVGAVAGGLGAAGLSILDSRQEGSGEGVAKLNKELNKMSGEAKAAADALTQYSAMTAQLNTAIEDGNAENVVKLREAMNQLVANSIPEMADELSAAGNDMEKLGELAAKFQKRANVLGALEDVGKNELTQAAKAQDQGIVGEGNILKQALAGFGIGREALEREAELGELNRRLGADKTVKKFGLSTDQLGDEDLMDDLIDTFIQDVEKGFVKLNEITQTGLTADEIRKLAIGFEAAGAESNDFIQSITGQIEASQKLSAAQKEVLKSEKERIDIAQKLKTLNKQIARNAAQAVANFSTLSGALSKLDAATLDAGVKLGGITQAQAGDASTEREVARISQAAELQAQALLADRGNTDFQGAADIQLGGGLQRLFDLIPEVQASGADEDVELAQRLEDIVTNTSNQIDELRINNETSKEIARINSVVAGTLQLSNQLIKQGNDQEQQFANLFSKDRTGEGAFKRLQAAEGVQALLGGNSAVASRLTQEAQTDLRAANIAEFFRQQGANVDSTGLSPTQVLERLENILINSDKENLKTLLQEFKSQEEQALALGGGQKIVDPLLAANKQFTDDLRGILGQGSPLVESLKTLVINNKGGANAGGFIPSFAGGSDGVARALRTESAMGASNPVLDYHPSIGRYVRDGATQPNFASVLRDHPEGMQAAINNSKTVQNYFAEGLIPKYANKLKDDKKVAKILQSIIMGNRGVLGDFVLTDTDAGLKQYLTDTFITRPSVEYVASSPTISQAATAVSNSLNNVIRKQDREKIFQTINPGAKGRLDFMAAKLPLDIIDGFINKQGPILKLINDLGPSIVGDVGQDAGLGILGQGVSGLGDSKQAWRQVVEKLQLVEKIRAVKGVIRGLDPGDNIFAYGGNVPALSDTSNIKLVNRDDFPAFSNLFRDSTDFQGRTGKDLNNALSSYFLGSSISMLRGGQNAGEAERASDTPQVIGQQARETLADNRKKLVQKGIDSNKNLRSLFYSTALRKANLGGGTQWISPTNLTMSDPWRILTLTKAGTFDKRYANLPWGLSSNPITRQNAQRLINDRSRQSFGELWEKSPEVTQALPAPYNNLLKTYNELKKSKRDGFLRNDDEPILKNIEKQFREPALKNEVLTRKENFMMRSDDYLFEQYQELLKYRERPGKFRGTLVRNQRKAFLDTINENLVTKEALQNSKAVGFLGAQADAELQALSGGRQQQVQRNRLARSFDADPLGTAVKLLTENKVFAVNQLAGKEISNEYKQGGVNYWQTLLMAGKVSQAVSAAPNFKDVSNWFENGAQQFIIGDGGPLITDGNISRLGSDINFGTSLEAFRNAYATKEGWDPSFGNAKDFTGWASGFVPNFSKMGEVASSIAAGYKNPVGVSDVKSLNIPGIGKSYYNNQEQVVNVPGLSQPFIVPPKNSDAASGYEREVQNKFGFSPYNNFADGFVPNLFGGKNINFSEFTNATRAFENSVRSFNTSIQKNFSMTLDVGGAVAVNIDLPAIGNSVRTAIQSVLSSELDGKIIEIAQNEARTVVNDFIN